METKSKTPPMKESDEAKPEQLDMARDQGEAYLTALKHMAKEEADSGGEKMAGNYVVAYAIEKAEGMYKLSQKELKWQEPGKKNCHIEISVRDGADNRFIPNLNISVTVVDENDEEIGTHKQEFLWHPWLYHYGRNWQVPKDGKYTLKVKIEAPKFMRHDKKNGLRYAEDVEVVFEGVKIKTGQK
jgi:hypothetical protein